MMAGITLIVGGYQSGKTHALHQRLRGAPGQALLVTPAGPSKAMVAQQHAAWGDSLLPAHLSLSGFFDLLAAATALEPTVCSAAQAVALVAGCPHPSLRAVRRHRGAISELADLAMRADEHLVGTAALDRAAAALVAAGHHGGERVAALAAAHRHLHAALAERGWCTPGQALQCMAELGPQLPYATIGIDDLMSISPAWIAVLAALGTSRQVCITAIDDPRLGEHSLLAAVRSGLAAVREHDLGATMHPQAPHAPAMRNVVAAALGDLPFAAQATAALGSYAYHDAHHAGRVIAHVLRSQQIAPGDCLLVCRSMDQGTLVQALRASGVGVRGRVQLPLASTAAGALGAALLAWCSAPSWPALLNVLGRLGAAADELAPEDGLPVLACPAPCCVTDLAVLGDGDAAAALAGLRRATSGEGDWQWNRDVGEAAHGAVLAWCTAWHAALLSRSGEAWPQHLLRLVQQLGLGLALGWATQLRDLARLGGLDDAVLAALAHDQWQAQVTEQTFDDADGLLLADAVRSRLGARRVVLVHGLEHDRWPLRQGGGIVLDAPTHAALVAELGVDLLQTQARASGELASLLAVLGRATDRVLLGVPTVDAASVWLADLAAQAGWKLDALRAQVAQIVSPGAPASSAECLADHEVALLSGTPAAPVTTISIGAVGAAWWQPKPSGLDVLCHDPLLALARRLACLPPLDASRASAIGNDVHDMLKRVVDQHPRTPAAWPQALAQLGATWVAEAQGAAERVERSAVLDGAMQAMEREVLSAAPDQRSATEQPISLRVRVGDQMLTLSGTADRIDTLADQRQRLVDYKRTKGSELRSGLCDGRLVQLAAYAAALRDAGATLCAAWYRSYSDGSAAAALGGGLPFQLDGKKPPAKSIDLARLDEIWQQALAALGCVAAGELTLNTDSGALSRKLGLGPVVRIDEQTALLRGVLSDEGDDGGEGESSDGG